MLRPPSRQPARQLRRGLGAAGLRRHADEESVGARAVDVERLAVALDDVEQLPVAVVARCVEQLAVVLAARDLLVGVPVDLVELRSGGLQLVLERAELRLGLALAGRSGRGRRNAAAGARG